MRKIIIFILAVFLLITSILQLLKYATFPPWVNIVNAIIFIVLIIDTIIDVLKKKKSE